MISDRASSSLPVLAVTGLAKEARLAAGPGVLAIGAGGDPVRLRALLARRTEPGCRAVVSFGIAGGLEPDLRPGDVLIASAIVSVDRRFEADPAIADALLKALTKAGARVRSGALAGVDEAVLTVAGKAATRALTGCVGVDMESHVSAAFAERHGLPFAALRIVCDPAARAIPAFAAKALKPNGEPDILAVLSAVARDPRQIRPLIHLARDSGTAFASLKRCRVRLGEGLGVPLLADARPTRARAI
ncbi:phosphorylase [Methylobacterium sp. J-068]|uniref:phosphorylase n=1 Tax=Methylobacterium sp. J-068 TaxID=2836649 RepID=UPI001FB8E1C4|nr:phosphorylase [Methylobacterium sp. J-068]MCJ2033061.1 phosphorylase [Methylobacterium sp. J-068]